MPRCANCWTGVDDLRGDCPACGAPLAPEPRSRVPRASLVGGAIVVAALAVAAVVLWPRDPASASTDRAPAVDSGRSGGPESPTPEVESPASAPPAEPSPEPAHWRWTTSDDASLAPVVLMTPRGPRVVVLLADLPKRETPTWNGRALALAVVHADESAGLVLVEARDSPLPAGIRPREVGAARELDPDQELRILATDGRTQPVRIAGLPPDGTLLLDAPAPRGAAVLDPNDRVVALIREPREAVPLDVLRPWLDAPPGPSLEDFQAGLRQRMTDLVVEDVERLLTRDPDVGQLRDAVARVSEAAVRTRDRERIEALARVERRARGLLIRRLAANGEQTAALGAARDALARHPDDASLLEAGALLAAAEGDLTEVSVWSARLRGLDASRAEALTDRLVDALIARADRQARAERLTDALAALDLARSLSPGRGDVCARRARVLEPLGRLAEAVQAAREAAALDPAHATLAVELAEALARANDPSTVEIPFDPRTHVIRARVSAGGTPLELVVDTGATTTTIPVAAADRLGLRDGTNRRVQVQTAGGVVEGEIVRLPTLTIGRLELRDVEAIAIDLPGALAGSGLLGMNALGRFRVEIDADRGILVLRRRAENR